MLDGLDAHEPEAMPVVVKFILHTITPANSTDILRRVRANLVLDSLSISVDELSSDATDATLTARAHHFATQTLEALKAGIRFQPSSVTAWLKVIQRVDRAKDHKAIDVFILLMVHELIGHKKTVESLFLRKTKRGHLVPALIHDVFVSHGTALRPYVKSIVSIAELLMRSADTAARAVSKTLYMESFLHFEQYVRQDILGALITHVGSASFVEVDGALGVLQALVVKSPSKVYPFYIMLKGILDYIDNLSVPQVRCLFRMLSDLGVAQSDTGGESDELHIFIRKMISRSTLRDTRVGVVGVAAMIQSYSVRAAADADAVPSCEIESLNLLKLVKSHLLADRDGSGVARLQGADKLKAVGLLFDELARVLATGTAQLPQKVATMIDEDFAGAFQELYLVSAAEAMADSADADAEISLKLMYSLNDEDEADYEECIVLKILSDLISPKGCPVEFFMPLCPLFSLFQHSQKRMNKGSLEDCDALLGCGMMAVTNDIVDRFDNLSRELQDAICHNYFLILNWFREVVNAFAGQSMNEYRIKTLQRITDIVEIEALLAVCLKKNPHFVPLPAEFEVDQRSQGKRQNGKRKREKGTSAADEEDEFKEKGNSTKKSRKADKGEGISGMGEEVDIMEMLDVQVLDERESKPKLDHDKFHSNFRELDLVIFRALAENFQVSELDTEMNTMERPDAVKEHKLEAPEVRFLLRDLYKKVRRSLHPPKATPWGGSDAKTVGYARLLRLEQAEFATWVSKQVPTLCAKLEDAILFVQEVLKWSGSDTVEITLSKTEHASEHVDCLELLFGTFRTLLQWPGFKEECNQEILTSIYRLIACRISDEDVETMPLATACGTTFRYFHKCAKSLPTAETYVALVELLEVIYADFDDDSLAEDGDKALQCNLYDLCQSALNMKWLAKPGRPISNPTLGKLLRPAMVYCDNKVEILSLIIDDGFNDVLASAQSNAELEREGGADAKDGLDKDMAARTLKTLAKHTFPTYYKCAFSNLASVLKSCDVLTHVSSEDDITDIKIERLEVCIDLWKTLQHLTSGPLASKVIIQQALKYGKDIVDNIATDVLPFLTRHFKNRVEDVTSLIKSLQKQTRYLQRLCSHVRDTLKDEKLAGIVPKLRRSLEGLVYKTNTMMIEHDCAHAFSVAALKHKDLEGREISTQIEEEIDDDSEAESDNLEAIDEDEMEDEHDGQESETFAEV